MEDELSYPAACHVVSCHWIFGKQGGAKEEEA
jgi:hypothetical protein